MRFKIEANLEYLIGRLRYGHYTTTIEANSQQKVEEMLNDEKNLQKDY